jgi:hypothetical protein
MTEKRRRVRRRECDILKIDLEGERHSYAQVSYDPLLVFFDGAFTEDLPLNHVLQLPVMFRVWVHNDAIKKGIWPVVGKQPLADENSVEPFFYKQDAISGRLFVHHSMFAETGWARPASASECEGLECAAVWEPEGIVNRLCDYYAGRPNEALESMKIDRRAYS